MESRKTGFSRTAFPEYAGECPVYERTDRELAGEKGPADERGAYVSRQARFRSSRVARCAPTRPGCPEAHRQPDLSHSRNLRPRRRNRQDPVLLGAGLDSSVLTFGACHKLTQGCKPKLDPTSARPEFRFTPIETAEAVDSAVGCQLSQRVFSVGCGCSHRNADSDYPAGSRAASRRASP